MTANRASDAPRLPRHGASNGCEEVHPTLANAPSSQQHFQRFPSARRFSSSYCIAAVGRHLCSAIMSNKRDMSLAAADTNKVSDLSRHRRPRPMYGARCDHVFFAKHFHMFFQREGIRMVFPTWLHDHPQYVPLDFNVNWTIIIQVSHTAASQSLCIMCTICPFVHGVVQDCPFTSNGASSFRDTQLGRHRPCCHQLQSTNVVSDPLIETKKLEMHYLNMSRGC